MKNLLPIYWESTKTCFKKYSVFKGRASRQEYVSFILFIFFVSFLLGFIEGLLGLFPFAEDWSVLDAIFLLATALPSWSVMVRRLHDINRSGWWFLINITIIGMIPFIYWVCWKKSDEGENKYGSNPLTGSEVF
tara:strand:+ start:3082 stop:3483 length:402 start_codon:yes stop_codon:yes gene_type:complete